MHIEEYFNMPLGQQISYKYFLKLMCQRKKLYLMTIKYECLCDMLYVALVIILSV
jgi:hypothetical protein